MSGDYYPMILYPPLVRRLRNGNSEQKYLKASFKGCLTLQDTNSMAKQGVSEKEFFRHLLAAFPGNLICQAVEFEIPGYPLRYSADFIFYHHSSGLASDIEIDEPYIGNTGKPHHCIDNDIRLVFLQYVIFQRTLDINQYHQQQPDVYERG